MFQGTIYQRFENISLERRNHTALAYLSKGHYREISYRQLNDLVLKLVNYFLDLGLEKGERVLILSENRWQWPVIDLACNYLGLILVPIHTTYSEKYIDYIISETKPKLAFISNQELIDNFFKIKKDLINNFQEIIIFEKNIKTDFDTKYFKDLIAKYPDNVQQNPISDLEAIMTIIYTSGTTGMPKGAMLSNRNIISNFENVIKYVPISRKDRFFSVLPLSHILERMAGQITPLLIGSAIYYAQSPKTLKDDIKKAKPTVFVSVPRIFEKIFDAIHDKLKTSSRISNYLFYQALKVTSKINFNKRNNQKINKYSLYSQKIFDRLVFKKIRNIFGGNLRLAISGGSSLDKKIARFFEDVNINIIEGYGLTETSPIISVNKVNDFKFGTVGHILENIDLKINNYKEILVKGSSIMSGYWHDEEADKISFDENGYFYTGDMGFVDSDGFLNIIGRKKEIIVLSTGKNIVPYNIEHSLNYDKYVDQSIIVGSNRKFVTALIVPDFGELKIYCQKNNIKCGKDRECLNKEEIHKLYKSRIDRALKEFADYEQVINFYLVPREFDQEHDELTPTLKLKRENIKSNFKNIINKLYQ